MNFIDNSISTRSLTNPNLDLDYNETDEPKVAETKSQQPLLNQLNCSKSAQSLNTYCLGSQNGNIKKAPLIESCRSYYEVNDDPIMRAKKNFDKLDSQFMKRSLSNYSNYSTQLKSRYGTTGDAVPSFKPLWSSHSTLQTNTINNGSSSLANKVAPRNASQWYKPKPLQLPATAAAPIQMPHESKEGNSSLHLHNSKASC